MFLIKILVSSRNFNLDSSSELRLEMISKFKFLDEDYIET